MGTLAGKRILIVEDESLIAEDLRRIIEGVGATPIELTLIERAARILAGKEKIDAELFDVRLSDKTSEDVARTLKRRKVPFLIIGGHPRELIRRRRCAAVPSCKASGARRAAGDARDDFRHPVLEDQPDREPVPGKGVCRDFQTGSDVVQAVCWAGGQRLWLEPSLDLRERVVAAIEEGLSTHQAAARFSIVAYQQQGCGRD